MKKTLKHKSSSIPLDYFLAVEDKAGYVVGWTLPALLGSMLARAEDMFGPRDTNYTILGVEFSPSSACIWKQRDSNYLTVQLHVDGLRNYMWACGQLAHECIHLLSPTGKKDANVLEEGLAVNFEEYYMKNYFKHKIDLNELDRRYQSAYKLTRKLLRIEPDIIRKLRSHEPTIARIPSDLILQICPAVPKKLAGELAKPFYRQNE